MRHFVNLTDLSPAALREILDTAHKLKAQKFTPPQLFKGLSLAMVFDKRSTRTRISFEVAMKQLGGHTIVMGMDEIQLGGKESIESTGKVLSRFVDGIMLRMSNHEQMEELAQHSTIPIINGMTNRSHPCQIMADLLTMEEKLGHLDKLKVAWFGDLNNVSQTYIDAAPLFKFQLTLALPQSLHSQIETNDFVSVTDRAKEAAWGADVLMTDTWESMGQEGKSLAMFEPFQVTSDLMEAAADHAIFMHCMPIHEWEEVTEEVAKSKASVIYDEAENRLHAQKAILAWCLKNAGVQV